MSNFWRSLDLPLFNCEIKLDLSWSKKRLSEISRTAALAGDPDANLPVLIVEEAEKVIFRVFSNNLYVSVVTSSISDNIKILENIKQGFKRTVSWNKYKSERTTQPKNNNLDYIIDSKYRNINRFFVLSFKNDNSDPTRDSFDKFY